MSPKNTKAKSPTKKSKRRALPPTTKREVLLEAGYKCGNPACRHVITLELHHMQWVKDGGGNDPSNLIALCPYCHAMHTAGQIPDEAIRHWKGLLVAMNHAFSRESTELLLFLADPDAEKVWVTGDGLLRFAGLIVADLVDVMLTEQRGQDIGTAARLCLSAKGKLFVAAWKKGDGAAIEAAQNDPTDVAGDAPKPD